MKQNIKKLGYALLSTFIILILYLTYLMVQQGEALANHPQNRRLAAKEAAIIRGTIYDRNGVKLAETRWLGDHGQRVYFTAGNVAPFAQVVGYVSEKYGSSGLEAAYGKQLLGLTDADAVKNIIDKILNRTPRGHDLVLTLDTRLQMIALQALHGHRGAVVALDPNTGAVLAMASSPAYDTNTIGNPGVWTYLNNNQNGAPLLNRATQGAYPPGSVMKIITGAGILANVQVQPGDTLSCPGYVVVDGSKIADNRAHGTVNFIKALAVSCNTYFAREGLKLGWDGFIDTANKFGLTKSPDLGIPVRSGTLATGERRTQSQLAESSFGQGDTLVSPLHMALAGAAIANNGVIMKPYLVQEIRTASGSTLQRAEVSPWLTATSPQIANIITQGMLGAVEWGTGTGAAIRGVRVAGKTGTAETKTARDPHSPPHSWFVGFAPADHPKVVVAVIVEKAGSGAAVATPIAREVMAAALFEH
ncbi:Peptidoglycan glycosyltransferase [Desulfotomaculum nigrificans CO-1-SRB]|uniref:Peptidoglycan glycosyltransferase n=1 Tax=Desulfotomaculum nigrificans (strain DSM 14880 / VKM B-2319 / CO-1-SRB) TaxID=868595 RepID=F6B4P0_DESCC|nr:penicillin-binding protein 2 [Desulfotomaculum nigrificans]AEF94152.1 Peptidoglycan glycosyltransferase [Desulfotomaculum nigrificans CO-1-SRB]